MSVLSLKDQINPQPLDRSTFDLSYAHAFGGNMGELMPVYLEEVVPGDTFEIDISHLIRFCPMAGPIVQNVDIFVHAFYVPHRLLFEDATHWNDFITGRTAETAPLDNLKDQTLLSNSIGTYYGLPMKAYGAGNYYVNKLPLLGYIKIYNDWYRNKVIQPALDNSLFNYEDPLFFRNWRKDYFTSCVPYPQLGDPATVSLDVTYLATSLAKKSNGLSAVGALKGVAGDLQDNDNTQARIENIDDITVDVNELKYAYAYQDWLRRMLHSGDEYYEQLLTVFGVKSSDERLQKVEYLGGYRSPVIMNEVTQTNSDPTCTPLGTLGGTGYSFGSNNNNKIKVFCEEHGYIHIIASIIPKSMYYGGIPRHFIKSLPLDYYFPQFANLPEQVVYKKELCSMEDSSDTETFGYIERYAEYKHHNDMISGIMTSDWNQFHFARMFTTEQNLNSTFITADDIWAEPFAVQNDIQFWGSFNFQVKAERPMPFNVDTLTQF